MTEVEILSTLCRIFKCNAEEIVDKATRIKVLDSCFCDKPDDRLYHHSDKTWWKREGDRLIRAEPPVGWTFVGELSK
jgi:hypothetical protein